MKTLKSLLIITAAATIVFTACEKKGGETKGGDSTKTTDSAGTSYKVDTEASTVRWVGKKVLGTSAHTGTIKIKSGEVKLTGNKIVGGTLVFDMTSIVNTDITDTTYNKKLIGHLRDSTFFDVAKYPTATYEITGSEGDKVKGKLTIKNKTEDVETPVSVLADSTKAKITGKTTFDRTKFDVKFNSKKFFENLAGDQVISDDIELDFDITAIK
jgi:polyisoprenoid-binding protein YceI